MKNLKMTLTLAVGTVVFFLTSTANAGGPLELCKPNVPFLWPAGGTNIPFNPDQGGLGILNNTVATTTVEQAFQVWEDVATSTVSYRNAGQLPIDVDETNFLPFFFPGVEDGLSPIVFDNNGAIFDLVFGADSGVLGFAGPDVLDSETCTITEGVGFLNGPAINTLEGLLDLMVHEFGHYTNLAHTVVNGQIFIGDNTGPTPDNETFGFLPSPDGEEVIETMYPFLFTGIDQLARTPHQDDIAILSTLYPEPDFLDASGTISGIISVRGTELSGVNVIARNVDDPFVDAASAITDDFTQGVSADGIYTINGLTPGATYAVYVDAILAGSFSTPLRLDLPGVEEFHNVASIELDTDDPLSFDGVTVSAGSPSTGIDVIFNSFQPDTLLPVGDDGSVEVFLPFQFRACGQRYDSVFVNANGNLTFGESDSQFAENIPEFLSGPPRVAGLWRDLSPFNPDNDAPQGSVSFSETRRTFTLNWRDVPEFPNIGSNSFAITLHRGFGSLKIETGELTSTNGLVGISCGGTVTTQLEQESDISDFRQCRQNTTCLPFRKPAVFELFDNDDHDLVNTRLLGATTRFFDRFEPNNSLHRAKRIRLPFSSLSERRFTEIRPAGEDVDYFRVSSLREGQTLIAETLTGQIDSVLGVFDANGNLLVADDDGGVELLSRIEFEIPVDGTYFIAVSTFPDLGFNGDGGTGPTGEGRYVLDVQAF